MGKSPRSLLKTSVGHYIQIMAEVFWNIIVCGSYDNTIKLWGLTTGSLLKSFESNQYCLNAPDRNMIVY